MDATNRSAARFQIASQIVALESRLYGIQVRLDQAEQAILEDQAAGAATDADIAGRRSRLSNLEAERRYVGAYIAEIREEAGLRARTSIGATPSRDTYDIDADGDLTMGETSREGARANLRRRLDSPPVSPFSNGASSIARQLQLSSQEEERHQEAQFRVAPVGSGVFGEGNSIQREPRTRPSLTVQETARRAELEAQLRANVLQRNARMTGTIRDAESVGMMEARMRGQLRNFTDETTSALNASVTADLSISRPMVFASRQALQVDGYGSSDGGRNVNDSPNLTERGSLNNREENVAIPSNALFRTGSVPDHSLTPVDQQTDFPGGLSLSDFLARAEQEMRETHMTLEANLRELPQRTQAREQRGLDQADDRNLLQSRTAAETIPQSVSEVNQEMAGQRNLNFWLANPANNAVDADRDLEEENDDNESLSYDEIFQLEEEEAAREEAERALLFDTLSQNLHIPAERRAGEAFRHQNGHSPQALQRYRAQILRGLGNRASSDAALQTIVGDHRLVTDFELLMEARRLASLYPSPEQSVAALREILDERAVELWRTAENIPPPVGQWSAPHVDIPRRRRAANEPGTGIYVPEYQPADLDAIVQNPHSSISFPTEPVYDEEDDDEDYEEDDDGPRFDDIINGRMPTPLFSHFLHRFSVRAEQIRDEEDPSLGEEIDRFSSEDGDDDNNEVVELTAEELQAADESSDEEETFEKRRARAWDAGVRFRLEDERERASQNSAYHHDEDNAIPVSV